MKKFVAVMLAAALCIGAAGALAFEMTGLDKETADRDWSTSKFFERMQALTGIEVQAACVSEDEPYQAMLAAMEAGEVTADVLFKANLTREQEKRLLDSGALIDLAPLIDEYMPNLSALLAQHPEWREVMTLEDGRIASLPLLNENERQVCVWINRSWLNTLRIEMPQNLQELSDALIAIRDRDPNLNGKRDELAADLTGVYEMRWLLPYFGIVADDYNLARNAQGEIVFAPEMDGYRDFIALLKQWYEAGILRKDAFTGVHSTVPLSDDKEKENVSGLIVAMVPYTNVPVDATTEYEVLLLPGPDGEIRWRDLLGSVWTGCYAVTSRCDNPGQALAWVDALYAEEGARLAYAGEEGVDYAYDSEGKWSFITDAYREISAIRSEVLMYTGTTMPGRVPVDFLYSVASDVDVHVQEQNARVAAISEQVTPAYFLGEADQKRANELCIRLGALVDTGIARFATGELELNDENYEAWLKELRTAGSEELTALFGGK